MGSDKVIKDHESKRLPFQRKCYRKSMHGGLRTQKVTQNFAQKSSQKEKYSEN